MALKIIKHTKKTTRLFLFSFLMLAVIFPDRLQAQFGNQSAAVGDSVINSITDNYSGGDKNFVAEKDFRVEKIPVRGGAEIITIFANLKGLRDSPQNTAEEVPLVSILRDTLGDDKIENDRLRYVWILSYARPSLSQKMVAAIPFLYTRTTNKGKVRGG